MKIIINRCFGGFSLSLKARDLLAERGFKSAIKHKKVDGNQFNFFSHRSELDPNLSEIQFRSHPEVIRVVEELGKEADGECAKLKIVEFDLEDFVDIEDFDGKEKVLVGNREVM